MLEERQQQNLTCIVTTPSRMLSYQLRDLQRSYLRHRHYNDYRGTSQVYTIKKAIYFELSALVEHQPSSVTYFLPTPSNNLPTAYECTRDIF